MSTTTTTTSTTTTTPPPFDKVRTSSTTSPIPMLPGTACGFVVNKQILREGESSIIRNPLLQPTNRYRHLLRYTVQTPSHFIGSKGVLASPGLPQQGDPYQSYAEIDIQSRCIRRQVLATNNPRIWLVDVEFDTQYEIDRWLENPLNQPPEINWDVSKYQKPLRRDAFGIPVRTSAGNPFDPPPMVEDVRNVLKIQRNEIFSAFTKAKAKKYQMTLNQNVFMDEPPLQVRLNTYGGEQFYFDSIPYWRVTYELEFRYGIDAFVENILDADFRDRKGQTFRDGLTQQPYANATMLNGRGRPIRDILAALAASMDGTQTTATVVAYDNPDDWPNNVKPPNADGIILGPDWYFHIRIDDEIMQVRAQILPGSPDVTWQVVRAQQGTSAATHINGAAITMEPYYLRYIPHLYSKFEDLLLPVVP